MDILQTVKEILDFGFQSGKLTFTGNFEEFIELNILDYVDLPEDCVRNSEYHKGIKIEYSQGSIDRSIEMKIIDDIVYRPYKNDGSHIRHISLRLGDGVKIEFCLILQLIDQLSCDSVAISFLNNRIKGNISIFKCDKFDSVCSTIMSKNLSIIELYDILDKSIYTRGIQAKFDLLELFAENNGFTKSVRHIFGHHRPPATFHRFKELRMLSFTQTPSPRKPDFEEALSYAELFDILKKLEVISLDGLRLLRANYNREFVSDRSIDASKLYLSLLDKTQIE